MSDCQNVCAFFLFFFSNLHNVLLKTIDRLNWIWVFFLDLFIYIFGFCVFLTSKTASVLNLIETNKFI